MPRARSTDGQPSELVRYSRAGDAFHYRWAARRCLRMIDPRCPVNAITIEASKKSKLAGECAIDLAEYAETADGKESTAYYQLKHSTVRTGKPFGFTEMSATLKAFAQRYSAPPAATPATGSPEAVSFHLVTNRRLGPQLRGALKALRQGGKISAVRRRRFEKATGLTGKPLRAFVSSLIILEGEADYVVQKEKLHGDIAEYLAGFVDNGEVEKIISLVSDRALPHTAKNRNKGEILREDVLQRLGVTSPRNLFPAPREFETLPHVIWRTQHATFLQHILHATAPTIIHAAGGVGKSVVARQIAANLPKGSLGLVYDCFGSGKYRNPSEPRHRACDALIQIANELAAAGHCRILVGHPGTPADALFRAFLERLQDAVHALRELEPKALLVLLIDAADNAEMAASENSDQCFASGLFRERLPEGCRLVALCRTERIPLLKAPSTVQLLPLEPFSETETSAHLRSVFPQAAAEDAREFHRLTGGNPRVQANALGTQRTSLEAILAGLGPAVTTVAAQINGQLQAAVAGIKDQSTASVARQVDAICLGLANLPPFIPIAVLAKAAQVEESTIKSFVSDLGRPLWHSDSSVQFRDEPTETWFREQFAASTHQIKGYVTLLEPLARDFPYVAKALPQLLLKAENYTRLIELALSDELLPENNPIDERNIRVYRLQFAFRAALRVGRLADAARLAFRAGEEVAGDQRQLLLLQQNADLITPLLDSARVQELAYRQSLSSAWQGSENVFSASLLSSVDDFKGEARGYLRAAERWLGIFFEERERQRLNGDQQFHERLADHDLAEMAWAHYNLRGVDGLVRFLLRWKPPEVVLRLTRLIVRRLVDAARFPEIDSLAENGRKSPYLILAVADALESVGRFPPAKSLNPTLTLLARKKLKQPPAHFHEDHVTPAIVSFCEAGAFRGLAAAKLTQVLDHYTASRTTSSVASDYQEGGRGLFLRAVALRAALAGQSEPDPNVLLPLKDPKSTTHSHDDSETRNLLQVIGGLLPWYFLRARFIMRDPAAAAVDLEKVRASAKVAISSRYRAHDRLPFEISAARFRVLVLKENVTPQELDQFNLNVIARANIRFSLNDRLNALRQACRIPYLAPIRSRLELSCSQTVEPASSESPEERAASYVEMARAVLAVSPADASAYFVRAIDAVSKFGDEMVDRWEAVVAVARRAADGVQTSAQNTYRFFKCAEMVGESVAREKHWRRNDVFRAGMRLNAPAAFAALSRWRDREVGGFNRQLLALATEAVETGAVAAVPGWCLSGFWGCNAVAEFAALCIRSEPLKANRQHILNVTARDLELEGGERDSWLTLKAVAEECDLDQQRLVLLLAACAPAGPVAAPATTAATDAPPMTAADAVTTVRPSYGKQFQAADWDALFAGVDLLMSTGIEQAESTYRKKDPPFEFEDFWSEVIKRVPAGREAEFLDTIALAESVDTFDISYLLAPLRQNWMQKASVKAAWPRFLGAVGKRYAVALSDMNRMDYWVDKAALEEADVLLIKSGMVRGLAESLDLVDARTFFGFVANIAPDLSPAEGATLLDYSMSRFEKHIDPAFGDGAWDAWLEPPAAIKDALAGLIWSALASPLSATRWQAAHCVRRLVEASCDDEIDSLFDWLRRDSVGAFGGHGFTFYRLHARLYFLIALARAAVDAPLRLHHYSAVLAQLALEGIPHILIQKTAADIALAIEQAKPGTYAPATATALEQVGHSPFPLKEVDGYPKDEATPWHAKGEVDLSLKVHLGLDFDHYWFNYLGDIFGVSEKQSIELGREAAVKHLGVADTDDYHSDPRDPLWQSRDYTDRGTSHSHGSYPENDDYRFYYSYHSFLSVAARLLSALPIIHRKGDYEENPWEYWLRRHSLARHDGRWLADRRDPSPVKRRAWTAHTEREHWRWSVRADDFLDVLLHQSPHPQWLCAGGHWTDCLGDQIEQIRVTSALVNPNTAEALANSLRGCRSPHDFHLPYCGEDENEFQTPPFELQGWIAQGNSGDRRLDGFDPYAKEIGYPPFVLGESFADALGMTADYERREWRRAAANQASFISEIWSEKEPGEREKPYREGERICGALEEFQRLCQAVGKNLIFCVAIERRLREYGGSSRDDLGYVPPYHKIFLLSADGQLRDTSQSHQLG